MKGYDNMKSKINIEKELQKRGRPPKPAHERGIAQNTWLYQRHIDKLHELKHIHHCSYSFILQKLIDNYADKLNEGLLHL